MNTGELAYLAERFRRTSVQLLYDFALPCPAGSTLCDDSRLHRVRSFCIVRLYDAWELFCRELVIESASARPITSAGVRLARAPGVQRRRDVLPALRGLQARSVPSWWEPNWGISASCLDAVRLLQLSNRNTLAAAIGGSVLGGASPFVSISGSSLSPSDQLRRVRNFVAHERENTAHMVGPVAAALGLPRLPKATDLAATVVPPGVSYIEALAIDLRVIAHAAVI